MRRITREESAPRRAALGARGAAADPRGAGRLSRRHLLAAAAGGAMWPGEAAASLGRALGQGEVGDARASTADETVGAARAKRPRMPAMFLSHGAPTLAVDVEAGAEFRAWARSMPRPSGVLVVSAHWERTPLALGTLKPARLMYDFGGFDRALYELEYEAPGAPELAARVEERLGPLPRLADRMWDHGVWVPLIHMLPEAEVPVLQLSLPSRSRPEDLLALGERLAPLRDEGVWILGSGGLVHNLGRLERGGKGPAPSWASEFDEWARAAVQPGKEEELVRFRERAPALSLAHPTLEHFLPLLVARGAAGSEDERRIAIDGFEFGSLSRTAIQFG